MPRRFRSSTGFILLAGLAALLVFSGLKLLAFLEIGRAHV
jgi:hypothetical protein